MLRNIGFGEWIILIVIVLGIMLILRIANQKR